MEETFKVLVTGGNGQLATAIKDKLAEIGHKGNYVFCGHDEVDITDYEELEGYLIENHIDVVVNCAAYTNVNKAQTDEGFDDAWNINVNGVDNLARACGEVQGAKLIHISTDYVYGGTDNTPYYPQAVLPFQLNMYGQTKYWGETKIFVYEDGKKELKPDYRIIRTSWLYYETSKNFLNTVVGWLENPNEEVHNVVYDQVGTPTYAGDLAEHIIRYVEAEWREPDGTIENYSNHGVASWYDFAMAIQEYYNEIHHTKKDIIRPCLSDSFPSPVRRPAYSVMYKESPDIPYWRDSVKKCMERKYKGNL